MDPIEKWGQENINWSSADAMEGFKLIWIQVVARIWLEKDEPKQTFKNRVLKDFRQVLEKDYKFKLPSALEVEVQDWAGTAAEAPRTARRGEEGLPKMVLVLPTPPADDKLQVTEISNYALKTRAYPFSTCIC